tara:strand:- start:940 stop:1131 length:192 start_codon:yes stop_codon:yes gene_type:complete
MRNLAFAVIAALAVASLLTYTVLFTGLDSLVQSVVFSSQENFWFSMVGFFIANLVGIALLPKR